MVEKSARHHAQVAWALEGLGSAACECHGSTLRPCPDTGVTRR